MRQLFFQWLHAFVHAQQHQLSRRELGVPRSSGLQQLTQPIRHFGQQ